MKSIITIENAEKVCHDISDLLCWWEGFKMGLKINSESTDYIIAQNGINAIRELNINIKSKLI